MTYRDDLKEALVLIVPSGNAKNMSRSENIKLMESYKILEIAQNDLLNGKLSPDEYFQLCESHQVNVDIYRENVEHNLLELRLV